MHVGWDIIWFIIGVSLLVTVHEFGHFWVARKLGFKVLRFSVGFGKPLITKIGAAPDYIEYVVAAIPLGGYVKLVDEREGAVSEADLPRAYASRRPWQRILMLLAGPAANFIFAIGVLWGVYAVFGIPHIRAVVDKVVVGSPLEKAGLRSGDELRGINGTLVLDQGDAALGLLDAISDEGRAIVQVRGRDGKYREINLFIADAAKRYELTEPNKLFDGLGFQFRYPPLPAVIGGVIEGGPAAKAGLLPRDQVIAIDGSKVRYFDELVDYVNARPDQSIVLTVLRGKQQFTRRLQTTRDEINGRVIGRIRIEPSREVRPVITQDFMTRSNPGVLASLPFAVSESWKMTTAQAKFFGRMLTARVSPKNLSSAIGIAGFAGDSARAGVETFLMFLVLISLSLGFLNLLPIPILDGGQVVFALAEWFKGSPISERIQAVGWQAGLLMLALLMGVALFNDVSTHVSNFFAHS